MEVRKGLVSNLRATIEVSGDEKSTSTKHITTFRLGSRDVLLRTSDPAPISDGDSIVVAGPVRGGGLIEVLAYRNESNGVSDDDGQYMHLLAGGFGLAVGIIGLLWVIIFAIQSREYPNLIASLALGAAAVGGLWAFVRGVLIRQAIGLLNTRTG